MAQPQPQILAGHLASGAQEVLPTPIKAGPTVRTEQLRLISGQRKSELFYYRRSYQIIKLYWLWTRRQVRPRLDVVRATPSQAQVFRFWDETLAHLQVLT